MRSRCHNTQDFLKQEKYTRYLGLTKDKGNLLNFLYIFLALLGKIIKRSMAPMLNLIPMLFSHRISHLQKRSSTEGNK